MPRKYIITSLTPRETEILIYVANGKSYRQIGHILQIAEQTVKNHSSHILRKLKANNRTHAVVLAISNGWISANNLVAPEESHNE